MGPTEGGEHETAWDTPELEEGIRLTQLLADPAPEQPRATREAMQQDIYTIANLFKTAIRRAKEQRNRLGDRTPTKEEAEAMERSTRACREGVEMLEELADQVRAGLRREHMQGLLEQVISRAHSARAAQEELHESWQTSSTPSTMPWPPARTGEPPATVEDEDGTNHHPGASSDHSHYHHYTNEGEQEPLPRRPPRLPEHRRRREHDGISESD